MALLTTFATTPLTLWLYPEWYRIKMEKWKRGEIDWDGNPIADDDYDNSGLSIIQKKARALPIQKLLVYLRVDNLPGLLAFVSMLNTDYTDDTRKTRTHHLELPKTENSAINRKDRPVQVYGMRLMEVTDRVSSVMKVNQVDDYNFSDPILNTFRTFGQLNKVSVDGALLMTSEHSYAESLASRAVELSSDFVLIPWSETGGMSEDQILLPDDRKGKFSNSLYSGFVSNILKSIRCNVGIFVNRGFGGLYPARPQPGNISRTISAGSGYRSSNLSMGPLLEPGHHIFAPYFGGVDDQVALRLVLQLAKNPTVTATIVHFNLTSPHQTPEVGTSNSSANNGSPTTREEADDTFFNSMRDSLPAALSSRVVFQSISSTTNDATAFVVETTKQDIGQSRENTGDLVIVGRNSMVGGTSGSQLFTLSSEMGPEAKRALGVLGEAMATESNGVRASVLVVQGGEQE